MSRLLCVTSDLMRGEVEKRRRRATGTVTITLQVEFSDFQRFTRLSTEVHFVCADPSLSHREKNCRRWVSLQKKMLANRPKTSDQGFSASSGDKHLILALIVHIIIQVSLSTVRVVYPDWSD
jgi:hypothetical protein